jgi:hypothetical protein
MKGIKIGVIVKKKCGKNTDTEQDKEARSDRKLRVADPEAHQKFVNNMFSVFK